MNNPTREGSGDKNASYESASYGTWAPLIASYAITASYVPSMCFSASYACTSSYLMPAPEPIPEAKDKGVREYFQKLGYTVECDGRRWKEYWYNISDEDGLVCQIDQGVPLADIVMDIIEFHQGKPGVSKSDYTLSGEESPEQKLLFKRVYDFEKFGIMPDGQMELGL